MITPAIYTVGKVAYITLCEKRNFGFSNRPTNSLAITNKPTIYSITHWLQFTRVSETYRIIYKQYKICILA